MTDNDPQLTPEQEKAVGRVQIAAVTLVLGLTIALRVLANSDAMGLWAMAAIGLPAGVAIALAATLAVSRVEGRPFREVVVRTFRRFVIGLRKCPARLRRRFAKAVGRSRPR